MSTQVKVEDLEVFRVLRAAILKFAQAASQALSAADNEITQTHGWLTGEQATHWQSQLRKRTEAVNAARDAVRQKKLYKDGAGKQRSAIEEEKHLARCIAAVEQAQAKILAVRKAIPKLEDEAQLYRGGVARLGDTLGGEIPNAIALLDRLALSMEQYMQVQAPAAGGPVFESSSADASFSRGEGVEPPPEPVPPAAETEISKERREKMSLLESKGVLSKATKDLFNRWSDARNVWSDAQSAEFEKVYLSQIEQDVRVALAAMDHMNQILVKIENDCE